MPEDLFTKICAALKIEPKNDEETLMKVLAELNVKYEHEIFEAGLGKRIIGLGDEDSEKLLTERYRPPGSFQAKPLSNTEVDEVLDQLEIGHPELFNLHINMLNFENYGGSLAQLAQNLADVLAGKYTFKLPETASSKSVSRPPKCFSCVVNSDRLGGRGKHWTCMFIDLRGEQPTVEFFNSSGNEPYREIYQYWQRLDRAITQQLSKPATFVPVSDIQHQRGDTECGVYCLYYLYQRLQKIDYRKFKSDPIADELMTKFRQMIFRPSD